MTSAPQTTSPPHIVVRIVVVLALIGLGVVTAVASTLTNPANLQGGPDSPVSDVGVIRGMFTWALLLSLIWLRTYPLIVVTAGLISALGLQTDPFLLAVALPVCIAKLERPWRTPSLVVIYLAMIANYVLHLIHLRRWPDADYSHQGMIAVTGVFGITLVLATSIGLYWRQRRRIAEAAQEVNEAHQRSDELSDELVRQREREDLAREVHDTLASRLSAISLQSGSIEDQADQDLSATARTLRLNASQALIDLRNLLASLREGGAEQGPPTANLHADLFDLLDLIEDATAAGLSVQPFIVVDGYLQAPDSLRRAVFRITQEALTNALRHSLDRSIALRIEGAPGRGIRLTFRNKTGETHSFTDGAGRGLVGIEERVTLLGGSLSKEQLGGWFTLTVTLPWELGKH